MRLTSCSVLSAHDLWSLPVRKNLLIILFITVYVFVFSLSGFSHLFDNGAAIEMCKKILLRVYNLVHKLVVRMKYPVNYRDFYVAQCCSFSLLPAQRK